MELGEAIHIKHGFAFQSQYFSDNGELVVLTPGNFNELGGFRIRPNKDRFYSAAIPQDYVLEKGDLIIAMTEQGPGLLGSSALVPQSGKYLHNQRLGLVDVIDTDTLDKGFLYYLFNTGSVRAQLSGSATGTKVRHTAPERVYRVKVSVPADVKAQFRIASVLRSYDDLIENNRRRIHLLEQGARLIYEEWFVHCRFPGHRRVRIVDGVPEGWKQTTLGERCSLVRGKSYRSADLVESGGKPFVNLKCVARHGGFRLDGLKRFSGQHKHDQIAASGDIVIALTDMTRERHVVAHVARIPAVMNEDAVLSMDMAKITPDGTVDKSWFYHFLRYSEFSSMVRESAHGTNVLHLKPRDIATYEFHCPPKQLQEHFGEVIGNVLGLQDGLVVENQKLAHARDLLLPRLMSGEVAE